MNFHSMSIEECLDFYNDDKNKSLSSFMPVKFKNNASLNHIDCRCSRCKNDLSHYPKGNLVYFENNDLYTFEGLGYCEKCNHFIPFHYRFRGVDGGWQFEFIDNKTKQWTIVKGKRTFWGNFKRLFK